MPGFQEVQNEKKDLKNVLLRELVFEGIELLGQK